MKKVLSLLLTLVILWEILPVSALTPENSPLKGKRISILGDSISTYTGISNDASVNPTLSGGAIYYTAGRYGVYQADTWWQQTIDRLGLDLTVNNSWSGSCVLNTRSGTVGAYIDRCVQLHNTAGEEPDIIAIYLGTNDFYSAKGTLGSADSIVYDTLIAENEGIYTYAQPNTSAEAYAIMLHKAMTRYPNAEVYCFTLLPEQGLSASHQALLEQFNQNIQSIAEHFGAYVVDLYNKSGIHADKDFQFYIADNFLHPGPAGMDAITGCFTSALLSNSRSISGAVYDVTYELTDVLVDQGTAYAVLESDGFECTFTIPSETQLEIAVTMDGRDITDSCYANRKISIETVTGDIHITAQSKPVTQEPTSFRWETRNDALISVTSYDNTENPLTMTHGTITDGVYAKTRFTMSRGIRLLHDLPWIIEWKSSGKWTDTTDGALLFAEANSSTVADAAYLYRRHNSDFISLGARIGGQYHNYGVALGANGIDGTVEHVYRLENCIYADGSNMVYLCVDGQEVGPMNHHWVGGTDKKETVDWVNGKDFYFSYMGTTPHTIGGCTLEYVQVWENGHAHNFQDGACIGCGKAGPYAGKTIACIGDSITAGVGVTKDQTDYVTLLAKSLEMSYIRLGASGTTLCTDGHATCNIKKLTESNLAGADVVTILMGINDFVQAKQAYYSLGSIDSADTSTIYGAVHMWCQKITELRQTASLKDTEFYFMTPVITSWNNSVSSARNWDQSKTNLHGYTLRDLCNAIKEVCALYDIPVIDLNLISGLYYNSAEDNTITEFGGDGAHPGVIGHQMMAEAIRDALLKNDTLDNHTHSYGSWITTTYPDCIGGEQQRVCSICTATERQALEGRGHTYVDNTCSLCGAKETATFELLDTRCNQVEIFTYEIGMTWAEWLNSAYNTGMGSCIAIWVSEGPNLLGSNPNMDIFVNGHRVDYNDMIREKDVIELVRYR